MTTVPVAASAAALPAEACERIAEINDLHKAFVAGVKKATLRAYEAGRLLHELRYRILDASVEWTKFIQDNFAFSRHSVFNYLRLYERYKDNPGELAKICASDGYSNNAIKQLAAPNAPVHERTKLTTLAEQKKYDIEQLFSQPCLSGVRLEKYRIEPVGKSNQLWLIDRSGQAIPVAEAFVFPPEGLPDIEQQELLKDMQIALEKYFARIEEYEKRGLVAAS